jgi:tetratricopeptide (TPR) repeat protein
LTEALNNLGHIYFYFQDYQKAREEYKKAIASQPQAPEGYYHLANVLYAMGEVDESKRSILTALKLYRQEGRNDIADDIQNKLNALTN